MTGRAFPVVWSLRGNLGVGRHRYRGREGYAQQRERHEQRVLDRRDVKAVGGS